MQFADINVLLLPCCCETQRFSPLTQIYATLSYPMPVYFTSRTLLTFCSNIDYLDFGLPTCRHFLDFIYKVQRRRIINTNALCSLMLLYCKLSALKRKLRQINSRKIESACPVVKASWNVMAHAQKPAFVFRRNGWVHLNRQGRHFIRLLAAEVCTSGLIVGSNAGYTMFRGCVKSTGYPLHSPVSPSLPLPYVTVCHHISTGVYSSVLNKPKGKLSWKKATVSLPISVQKCQGSSAFSYLH